MLLYPLIPLLGLYPEVTSEGNKDLLYRGQVITAQQNYNSKNKMSETKVHLYYSPEIFC
jgi:hypothetical protein